MEKTKKKTSLDKINMEYERGYIAGREAKKYHYEKYDIDRAKEDGLTQGIWSTLGVIALVWLVIFLIGREIEQNEKIADLNHQNFLLEADVFYLKQETHRHGSVYLKNIKGGGSGEGRITISES